MVSATLPDPPSASLAQVASQLGALRFCAQLVERRAFDLTDPFARERERTANLFERVLPRDPDPEAHSQHLLLARGKRVHEVLELARERVKRDGVLGEIIG